MSRRRRQDYVGCSLVERDGELRLRYRWDRKQPGVPTGMADTAVNRRALEPLRRLVGAVLRAGKDPAPVIADALQVTPTGPAVVVPVTVRSYYAGWILQQVAPLVRKAQTRDYRHDLEGYVLPVIGDLPLSTLKASDLRGLQSELLTIGRPRVAEAAPPRRGTPSRHRPLSVKTVKNALGGSLRAMLRQARRDGLLGREQFEDLFDLEWPKPETPEPDPFTGDERTRILRWFAVRMFRTRGGSDAARFVARVHPSYHAYLHTLFFTGMRPSEAAGLQWGDIDLGASRAHIRRSRHLGEYGAPKTASARRTVELFPETVRLLRDLQPLRVTVDLPVFTNTRGTAIEPNSLLPHWYAAQRALGIRVRGLYSTKDTFVTMALHAGVRIAWLETQTGVNYATLRRHYGKWMPTDGASELERFRALDPALFDPNCARKEASPGTISARARKLRPEKVRKGGLEPPRVFSPQDSESCASANSATFAKRARKVTAPRRLVNAGIPTRFSPRFLLGGGRGGGRAGAARHPSGGDVRSS